MPLQRLWRGVWTCVLATASLARAEDAYIAPSTLLASVFGAGAVLLGAALLAHTSLSLRTWEEEVRLWCNMAHAMLDHTLSTSLAWGTVVLRPFHFREATRTDKPRRRARGPAPPWVRSAYQRFGQEPGPLPPDAAVRAVGQPSDPEAPYFLGLYNPGVYCFMNSVVQSLASVVHLAHFLDALAAMAERYDVPTPVADIVRELVVVLDTPQKRRGALAPKQLVHALGGVSQAHGMRTLLSAHQQQDAQELALLLLHALDQELGAVQLERQRQLEVQNAGLRGVVAPSILVHGALRSSFRDTDAVANPFRGMSAQRTSCARCGYAEAIRHFALSDLSLSVPMGVRVCTLEQCFRTWTQLEQVEWICYRCSITATLHRERADLLRLHAMGRDAHDAETRVQRLEYVLACGLHESEVEESAILDGIRLIREPSDRSTKQVMLARPPRVLLLHLNRSAYVYGAMGATKNNVHVRFPEHLDVAPYTTAATLSMKPTESISAQPPARSVYQLSAVVVHYGAHHAGHYVAFRRHPSGWTRVSDDRVEACTLDTVLAQNPYLLFYERAEGARIPARRATSHARLVHSWGTSRFSPRTSTPLRS